MSPTFSSALAKLDGSLQSVHAQLNSMGAGLEVNDDQLSHSLTDARYHAAMLRDLIRAERPGATWTDRKALNDLVRDLDAAVARRNLQRRAKLLDLANELDAGRIKHRFDARRESLNTLRLDAVQELRSEAALSDQLKELPGPTAGAWLHWVWNLQETKDAHVFAELRRDFPALECFACEMEEGYWIRGSGVAEGSAQAPKTSILATPDRSGDASIPSSPQPVGATAQPESHDRSWTGNYDTSLALPYQRRSHQAQSGRESLSDLEPATPGQDASVAVISDEAPSSIIAPRPGSDFAGEKPDDHRNGNRAGKSADAELDRLKALLQSDLDTEKAFQWLRDLIARFRDLTPQQKKLLLAGGPLLGMLVLSLVLGLVYHFSDAGASKMRAMVWSGAKFAGVVQDPVLDSEIQRDLDQKLAGLKGSFIQANVQAGVVTLAGTSPTKWESLHAETLASQVRGVKAINNQLQVEELDTSAAQDALTKAHK